MNNQSILKWSRDLFIKKFLKVVLAFILTFIIEGIFTTALYFSYVKIVGLPDFNIYVNIIIEVLVVFIEGLIAYLLNVGIVNYLIKIYDSKKESLVDIFNGFKNFSIVLIAYFIQFFLIATITVLLYIIVTNLPSSVYLWLFQLLLSIKSDTSFYLFFGTIGFLFILLIIRIISPYALVPLLINNDNYNQLGSSEIISTSKTWMKDNKNRYSGIILYYYVCMLLFQIIINFVFKNSTGNMDIVKNVLNVIGSAIISIELTIATTKLLYEIKHEHEVIEENKTNANNNQINNNQPLPNDLNNPYNLKQMSNMQQNQTISNVTTQLPNDLNNPYNLKQMSAQQLQNNYSNTNNNQNNVVPQKDTPSISSLYNQNNQGEVVKQTTCPNCGTVVSSGNVNCPNCGHQIIK